MRSYFITPIALRWLLTLGLTLAEYTPLFWFGATSMGFVCVCLPSLLTFVYTEFVFKLEDIAMTKAKQTVKQLTEAEKIQERIKRYDEQAAEIRAKAARLKARVSEEKRKKETQVKIILGAAVQAYLAKASDVDGDLMRDILVDNLSLSDAKKVGLVNDPLGLLDT